MIACSSALKHLREDPRLQLLQRALGADGELHLVGGTIRDALLAQTGVRSAEPDPTKATEADLDLASALLPEELIRRLELAGIRTIPTGLQHQTVTAVPVQGLPAVEITTFRSGGMRPEGGVRPAENIEEDLQYRDFTVNALALSLETGELLDVVGGLDDLRRRKIRAVGNAEERFREDPLRAIRMVRFACLPEFQIDHDTLASAGQFASAIPQIAVERVREEFNKILLSTRPTMGIRLLLDLGFLEHIMPELVACDAFEQNRYHPHDVLTHTLVVVEKTKPDLILRLAALLHDIGKPPTLTVDEDGERHFYRHESVGTELAREMLERLRYSNAVIDAVCTLVRTHMRPVDAGAGGLRRLLRDTGELFPLWRELKEADASSTYLDPDQLRVELKAFDETMEEIKKGPDVSPLKNLAIGGKDLIALGLTPGPKFKEILLALHEQILDQPELNDRDTLLGMVREMEGLD